MAMIMRKPVIFVRERLGIDEIEIYQIGATIGVHTGPYPIGVGIIKRADWEA